MKSKTKISHSLGCTLLLQSSKLHLVLQIAELVELNEKTENKEKFILCALIVILNLLLLNVLQHTNNFVIRKDITFETQTCRFVVFICKEYHKMEQAACKEVESAFFEIYTEL